MGTEANLDSEIEEQMDDFVELEQWASEAVRGANDWLITLRNAEDEGIEPWSDQYALGEAPDAYKTEQESGMLSYCEGLTALTLTDEVAREHRWMNLQPELVRDDLKEIVGVGGSGRLRGILTEEGEKPGYNPDPYLPRELTNNFTDAVSFSTSVLMGALEADLNTDDSEFDITDDELSVSDIKLALKQNLHWLIDNRIETEDGRYGWSWIGKEADKYRPEAQKPFNYFTYSAVIPLVDFYQHGGPKVDISAVEEVVTEVKNEREEDNPIVDTLKGARDFLLEQNWAPRDDAWGDPGGRNADLMTTCYTIIALSYIDNLVDEITVDEERPTEAMRYLWEEIKFVENEAEDDNLWTEKKEYSCQVKENFEKTVYYDGSGPYILLDAIFEFLNYELGDPEQVVDDDETKDDLREWAETFAKRVLAKCWAGTDGFPQKGFRHLGNPVYATEDAVQNPTAIYTTGVAIETFLTNVLRYQVHPSAKTGTDESDSEDTETETQQVSQTRAVEDNRTINLVLNGQEKRSEYPDEIEEIEEQLTNIRSEVTQLSNELGKQSGGENIEEIDEENLQFIVELYDLTERLRREYNESWEQGICNNVADTKVSNKLQENWKAKFRRMNEEHFLEYLARVYFCPDQDTYEDIRDEVLADDRKKYLMPPQWQIVDEIDGWNKDDFESGSRKNFVRERVDELIQEPWGGNSQTETVVQFKDRFKEEAK